jgi:hypothetical protein
MLHLSIKQDFAFRPLWPNEFSSDQMYEAEEHALSGYGAGDPLTFSSTASEIEVQGYVPPEVCLAKAIAELNVVGKKTLDI